MEYAIENEFLKVTVTTHGAQVKSVLRKCDGVEHMWKADPSVWGYHAPILFPYCGRTVDGKTEYRGKVYDTSKQHGFARLMEHTFVGQTQDTIQMELTDNAETMKVYPFHFRLLSTIRLEGDRVHHTLTVENRDEDKLYFGIGYHPAFAVPFDDGHKATDYSLRFQQVESPMCIDTSVGGLTGDRTYYLGHNINQLPVTDGMFNNDSHCMVGLASKTLGLYENGTGRGVECSLEGFPFCLIWSTAGTPQFICIEPWMSLPSPLGGSTRLEEKPAAAVLEPGQRYDVTLTTRFVR